MSEGEILQGEALPEIPQEAQTDALIEGEPSTPEAVEPAEPEAPKPKGVQKRIDELTANWREEQRTRQRLEGMLEQVLAERRQPAPEPQKPAEPQGEPQLEQFETYEQYVRALARYEAKQERAAWDAEQQQRVQAEQRQALQSEFQTKVQAFKQAAPDFDQVVTRPGVAISDAMLEVIEQSDLGPQLAYHLGQNPDLSQRLFRLSPTLAAKELGKLEVQLSLPQPKTVSNAPAPIEPLAGDSGRGDNPEKMTGDEWVAWRRAQLRK